MYHTLYQRYLQWLGVSRQKPSLAYLRTIVGAQLSKMPFENISKLYYQKHLGLKGLPGFERYLEGAEKYGFGGTCYANNYYLNRLLHWLGFEVRLCGADMKNPDVHLVNIVGTGDGEYLVDAGYAAPFSEPLPLHLTENYTIDTGNHQYVLKPRHADKPSEIALYRQGEWIHGYRINPRARSIREFQEVITHSFDGSSNFMNALLLARLRDGAFITIHNWTVSESRGKIWKTHETESPDQLATEIRKYFGIPQTLVLDSLEGLSMQRDGYSGQSLRHVPGAKGSP